MTFTSAAARERYADLVRVAANSVVALDYDGTLAPIVDDPEAATIHPGAPEVLGSLAGHVAAVAVVTGRPAAQVLDLGGLAELGRTLARSGTELLLFGQYGNQRWSTSEPRIVSAAAPAGLAGFARELPEVLRTAAAGDAYLEDKGLAYAVHTRRLPDPDAAFERLLPLLSDLAARHGLAVEPGRQVVEVRGPGMHKGDVVTALSRDRRPDGFLFAGDDLGDVEAFQVVAGLRDEGVATLLVCSASAEQQALVDLADVVVPGPTGVLDLLARFARDAVSADAT